MISHTRINKIISWMWMWMWMCMRSCPFPNSCGSVKGVDEMERYCALTKHFGKSVCGIPLKYEDAQSEPRGRWGDHLFALCV